jgi:hypothetical protein
VAYRLSQKRGDNIKVFYHDVWYGESRKFLPAFQNEKIGVEFYTLVSDDGKILRTPRWQVMIDSSIPRGTSFEDYFTDHAQ